ncbi:ParB N-terminal domain-containing protein [Oceaniovalibus sp. ACAM 378]|uniref:ParB N-terminal domain-containing protein n=1 Tax=Oceaniovalibus sp. ACAM 378 TaxID=2599923 RepID=UPI0011DA497D|nr:ParB N-terminal domain-containing protein [Oceaniovalibus sp. ACAM 378]TYB87016.1 chromosome partitioning protein ParB [Oceaniovalibus sp. ACAM 378]
MPVKFSLPIADIQVPGKRKKTLEPDKVSALAEDMLENGQTTPISVRSAKDGYVLIEGYHRLEALRALGEKTVVAFEVRARLH